MRRRSFIGGLLATIGVGRTRAEEVTTLNPPVPTWRPSFTQPLDNITDRVSYYSNGQNDFVVLRNGTCVILDPGRSDEQAEADAKKVLASILGYHPDMNPTPMDDGNILVRYNHPAANVVLQEVAKAHWQEIEEHHLDGLTPDEVLITPLGPNVFDDFGKQALLGRAYMFMDALDPRIAHIYRRG